MKKSSIELFEKVNKLASLITKEIDNCDVLGTPVACGVAFKFKNKLKDLDYAIAEALHEVGGWEISRLQFPPALFFQSGHGWADEVEQLVKDLKEAVKLVQNDPAKYKKTGMAGVYGAAATLPDRDLVEDTTTVYLDVIHSPF